MGRVNFAKGNWVFFIMSLLGPGTDSQVGVEAAASCSSFKKSGLWSKLFGKKNKKLEKKKTKMPSSLKLSSSLMHGLLFREGLMKF